MRGAGSSSSLLSTAQRRDHARSCPAPERNGHLSVPRHRRIHRAARADRSGLTGTPQNLPRQPRESSSGVADPYSAAKATGCSLLSPRPVRRSRAPSIARVFSGASHGRLGHRSGFEWASTPGPTLMATTTPVSTCIELPGSCRRPGVARCSSRKQQVLDHRHRDQVQEARAVCDEGTESERAPLPVGRTGPERRLPSGASAAMRSIYPALPRLSSVARRTSRGWSGSFSQIWLVS